MTGKPRRELFIWVTWLAKQLAGGGCPYSLWFRAHFQNYTKAPERDDAFDLNQWTIDHAVAVGTVAEQYRADGWKVTTEDANSFKYQSKLGCLISGKPDLICTRSEDGRKVGLIPDVKTGKRKEDHIYQVQLYLLLAKSNWHLRDSASPSGLLIYSDGNVEVPADSVGPAFLERVRQVLSVACADEPAAAAPGLNCAFCDISRDDCEQRVESAELVLTGEL